jgi:hypothetical protein
MYLTLAQLKAAATARGGWTYAQMQFLGAGDPPRKGWLKAAIGREMSENEYETLKALGRGLDERRRMDKRRDNDTPSLF